MSKRWVNPMFGIDSTSTDGKLKRRKEIAHNSVESWLVKYEPQTKDDLAVQPKKLREVEDWILNWNVSADKKVLLLMGPCGCGKTTSLKVLAKRLNYELIEWINHTTVDYDDSENQKGQKDVFEVFLKSLLYRNLRKDRHIVLIKDLPNVYSREPREFHNVFKKYYTRFVYPVVLISNDIYFAGVKLYTDEFLSDCGISTISFNAVIQKYMVKTLQHIVKAEGLLHITPKEINDISRSFKGDLRNAIATLSFRMINKKSNVGDKDDFTNIFHSIGRVIYPKRTDSSDNYRFEHDPEDIITMAILQPQTFVNFLHENYLSRFSSIQNIASATKYLCLADKNLARRYESNEGSSILLSMCIRSFMVFNDNPRKTYKPIVQGRDIHAPDSKKRREFFASCIPPDTSDADFITSYQPYLRYLIPKINLTMEQSEFINRSSYRKSV